MPTLYLIPTSLGDCTFERVFPPYNAGVVAALRHFVVEDVRSARRFIKRLCPGAKYTEVLSVGGSSARGAKEEVTEWLAAIGFAK